MASKLTDITASYHSFKKDQVLTESQMNEFLNYFDDQGRMSRILLSGVGNICGFNIDTSDLQQIYISQGCGVTTDGNLVTLTTASENVEGERNIKLSGIPYTNYKQFFDDNAQYPHFLRNGNQINIWELITAEQAAAAGNVDPSVQNMPNFQNMVALLYVESYDDEADLCEGLSCDAQGVNNVANLRVLVMSQEDADYVLSNDELFTKHDLMATYMQMKDLVVKRVVLNSKNTDSITSLVSSYNISNEMQLMKDLTQGLDIMRQKLDQYDSGNPLGEIIQLLGEKLPVKRPSETLYFQYRYDLLRDVVDAYNELKELFIKITTECFPTITAFPKHLFIGKLSPKEEDILMKRYRHDFYRSPILEDEAPEYGSFSAALVRLHEQLKGYPQLPETSTNGQLFESQIKFNSQALAEKDLKIKRGQGLYRSEIRITPSTYGPGTELGKKAIPFYYTISVPFLKAWDYAKTAVGKHRRNMAYDRTLLENTPAIQTPLLYNLEKSNFYRIEGIHGQDYRVALDTVNTIRNNNGLSFDTKVIGIDLDKTIVIDQTNYEADFEDLSVLLNAWVQEQECNLASVTTLVSAYSLKEPGKNLKEEVYTPRVATMIRAAGTTRLAEESGAVSATASVLKAAPSGVAKFDMPLVSLDPVVIQQQKTTLDANRGAFGKTSVVLENLTTDKNAVGYAFLQAVESNIKGSATEFITEGNFHATAIISQLPDPTVWNPDKYLSIVDNTLQILSYSHILSNSIPTKVADITDEVIANYNTNINNLCVNLKRVQVVLTTSSSEALNDKNRGILTLLVSQLTSICCASKQLQTLLVEIDRRKDSILERLTLKKFVEEHPGLEHLAGVAPGGTFVMVYLKKGLNINGAISNTPNGTVVADFSLPYMCCSDQAPINYIIPRAPVKLRLDTEIFCLKDQPGALFFEVEPSDGVIKADKQIPGVTIVGKVLTIDPAKIPSSALGQKINFTVNDQITDTHLTIVRPLNAFFEVPESPVTETKIRFQPIGDFPADTKFHWDFGDGKSSTEKLVFHQFDLPVNEENKVTVTLTVTPASGACPTVDKHDISFQETTINLPQSTFCISDNSSYDFNVEPKGATAVITGPGVVNGRTFIPSQSNDTGEIQFFLNGNPSLKVTVNPLPSTLATGFLEDDVVTLSGQVGDEKEYDWRFEAADGTEFYRTFGTLEVQIPLKDLNQEYVKPGTTFYVKLVAGNDCGQTESVVAITVPADTKQCNADAKTNFVMISDRMREALENPEFSKLKEEHRALYFKGRDFIDKALKDFQTYMDGKENTQVVGFMATELTQVRDAIFSIGQNNPSQRELMINLYILMAGAFFLIVQCQEEDMYKSSALRSMMDVIISHLDPRSSGSFAVKKIDVDPARRYQFTVMDVIEYRQEGRDSYTFMKKVIDLLVAYYGKGETAL